MSKVVASNGDVFESWCDLIDVTSNCRVDENWRYTDPQGHVHRWYTDGKPAVRYSPEPKYETPTLEWVKTGEEYWGDDDEPHDVGEWRCRQCGAVVERGFTADQTTQYIAGLRHYRINGERVSKDDFQRRWELAR